VPYWRSRNHFHNPIDNSGFSGWWDTGIFSGMSAVNWISQPANTQSCGYYSWNDARDYYYKALTSTDKATRETNFADTFRAIGQSMHLAQDMSVPEHTRNNGHYFSYDYEVWAKGLRISDFFAVSFTPSAVFPLSINNLSDTDQYDGSNPDITMQATIGLAEYSNANFLSPSTIFTANFTYPAYSDMSPKFEYDSTSGRQILYLSKSGHGETINYFARAGNFYNYLPPDYKKLNLTLDDSKVYENYAAKLIPRAIGYSSQILSYFFRGQLDVEIDDGSMKVKNVSNEAMTGGQLELYYDNSNEERNLIVTDQVTVLVPGSKQTIAFNQSQGATSYILVYRGKLGDETNAIVGKVIQVGACCVPDGSCKIMRSVNCSAAGGTYKGDNTKCDPNPCGCCYGVSIGYTMTDMLYYEQELLTVVNPKPGCYYTWSVSGDGGEVYPGVGTQGLFTASAFWHAACGPRHSQVQLFAKGQLCDTLNISITSNATSNKAFERVRGTGKPCECVRYSVSCEGAETEMSRWNYPCCNISDSGYLENRNPELCVASCGCGTCSMCTGVIGDHCE
jgi:hypothetical protein